MVTPRHAPSRRSCHQQQRSAKGGTWQWSRQSQGFHPGGPVAFPPRLCKRRSAWAGSWTRQRRGRLGGGATRPWRSSANGLSGCCDWGSFSTGLSRCRKSSTEIIYSSYVHYFIRYFTLKKICIRSSSHEILTQLRRNSIFPQTVGTIWLRLNSPENLHEV